MYLNSTPTPMVHSLIRISTTKSHLLSSHLPVRSSFTYTGCSVLFKSIFITCLVAHTRLKAWFIGLNQRMSFRPHTHTLPFRLSAAGNVRTGDTLLTHALTHSLTHSLHSRTHSLHSLTHSLHSLTHSLTHSRRRLFVSLSLILHRLCHFVCAPPRPPARPRRRRSLLFQVVKVFW